MGALAPRRLAIVAAALLLAACAAPGVREVRQRTDIPRQVELERTPFFPQEDYQCGPAALATALGAAGLPADPQKLAPQVYLPARKGSLQIEMLAGARRNGAVAVTIPPRLDALLRELDAGHPVVVLQNLGLSWIPRWHYAVAVGYDLDEDVLLLRSGRYRRLETDLDRFTRTWARGDYWAFVALPPGRLPATAQEPEVVQGLTAFEKLAPPGEARKGYAAAVARWPASLPLLIGLGTSAYAAGDKPAALEAFDRAAAAHPESGAAHNNRASVLADLGRLEEARASARKAVALGGPWREVAQRTLQEIERRDRP